MPEPHDRKQSDIEFLRRISIFRELGPAQLEKLQQIVKPLRYEAGTIIMREGDLGDSIFLMKSGVVELSKSMVLKGEGHSFEDRDKTVTRLEADRDGFFGEIALLHRTARTATVKSLTPCELCQISKEEFERLTEGDTELGFKVIRAISKILCERLTTATQDIIKLTTALSILIH